MKKRKKRHQGKRQARLAVKRPLETAEDRRIWALVLENQGLVGNVIKRDFRWLLEKQTVLDYDDLFQTGLMGLHHALKLYDPTTGFAISTYSYMWIRQYISRAWMMEGFRCIRIPVHQYDKLSKLRKEFGHDFDLDDLHARNKVNDTTYRALEILTKPVAIELDAPLDDDAEDKTTLLDFIMFHEYSSLYDHMEHLDMHALVILMCNKLRAKEKEVIERRFGLNGYDEHSFREAGAKFGVTTQRVQQIQKVALEKLRKFFAKNTVLFKELGGAE